MAEYNVAKLRDINRPIAVIKAVHSGPNAHKASSDDAGGLDPEALGTVVSICYQSGSPPDLPLAVMVRFDNYFGPTLPDQTVSITPLRHTWSSTATQCSRLQLPLKLAWAVTVHRPLTLPKVVIDVGRKEFCSGLTFVANDLLFSALFPYQRLSNISKKYSFTRMA